MEVVDVDKESRFVLGSLGVWDTVRIHSLGEGIMCGMVDLREAFRQDRCVSVHSWSLGLWECCPPLCRGLDVNQSNWLLLYCWHGHHGWGGVGGHCGLSEAVGEQAGGLQVVGPCEGARNVWRAFAGPVVVGL